MISFVRRVLHLGVLALAGCQRILAGLERLFRGKAEVAKRASGRLEALQRKEMELERLDRLRNPRDYQGR